jgi:hypothetical protein
MDILNWIALAGFAGLLWILDSRQTSRYRKLDSRLERIELAVIGLGFIHGGPEAHQKLLEEERQNSVDIGVDMVESVRRDLHAFMTPALSSLSRKAPFRR